MVRPLEGDTKAKTCGSSLNGGISEVLGLVVRPLGVAIKPKTCGSSLYRRAHGSRWGAYH